MTQRVPGTGQALSPCLLLYYFYCHYCYHHYHYSYRHHSIGRDLLYSCVTSGKFPNLSEAHCSFSYEGSMTAVREVVLRTKRDGCGVCSPVCTSPLL